MILEFIDITEEVVFQKALSILRYASITERTIAGKGFTGHHKKAVKPFLFSMFQLNVRISPMLRSYQVILTSRSTSAISFRNALPRACAVEADCIELDAA